MGHEHKVSLMTTQPHQSWHQPTQGTSEAASQNKAAWWFWKCPLIIVPAPVCFRDVSTAEQHHGRMHPDGTHLFPTSTGRKRTLQEDKLTSQTAADGSLRKCWHHYLEQRQGTVLHFPKLTQLEVLSLPVLPAHPQPHHTHTSSIMTPLHWTGSISWWPKHIKSVLQPAVARLKGWIGFKVPCNLKNIRFGNLLLSSNL